MQYKYKLDQICNTTRGSISKYSFLYQKENIIGERSGRKRTTIILCLLGVEAAYEGYFFFSIAFGARAATKNNLPNAGANNFNPWQLLHIS